MAALMSVADNLPPGSPRSTGGSPPTNVAPRSASRGSQHSPNSTGMNDFYSFPTNGIKNIKLIICILFAFARINIA